MKKFATIVTLGASLAALTGCATSYPGPANYGTRAYAQPADPNGWQVVSVTPVPTGTGATNGDAGRVTSQSYAVTNPGVVSYSPGVTTVVTQPVYVQAPVYAPYPVYADPFWYPPVSIGLGLNFGWSNWGGHRGYRGGYGGARFRGHR